MMPDGGRDGGMMPVFVRANIFGEGPAGVRGVILSEKDELPVVFVVAVADEEIGSDVVEWDELRDGRRESGRTEAVEGCRERLK